MWVIVRVNKRPKKFAVKRVEWQWAKQRADACVTHRASECSPLPLRLGNGDLLVLPAFVFATALEEPAGYTDLDVGVLAPREDTGVCFLDPCDCPRYGDLP